MKTTSVQTTHWSETWNREAELADLGVLIGWVGRAEALAAEGSPDGLGYFTAGTTRVTTPTQLKDAIAIAKRVAETRGYRW